MTEEFEWCGDCKEYDQEQHCCHRWTKVIKQTVEELQIIRCKDCNWYNGHEKYCSNDVYARENGYCYLAERKEE